MTRSYLIGGLRLHRPPTAWVVPERLTEADVCEQMLATPDPRGLSTEWCGGVSPNASRGSIWWWVSC